MPKRVFLVDTRALEHPKPLEIMLSLLPHCAGEKPSSKDALESTSENILCMIHRLEPRLLYDILHAQGLAYHTQISSAQIAQNILQARNIGEYQTQIAYPLDSQKCASGYDENSQEVFLEVFLIFIAMPLVLESFLRDFARQSNLNLKG
ncbi:hypothetical protein CQA49_01885 [Helicobacter sp. MIT 00-7814]|uniref:hypothetical protein n=1 Tax=unclassified Helicobacter TaxID=2593540 RepID=UPI000E1F887C|nr:MULTISPECIES: hypothetical protein [unclassified Helicobacter]RDU56156.1 hypothetical protein CQA37_02330 [Helicobacter sp. MIT 99-10781]RDU56253.1 hypothetical protein CQA49_01885 [Helicobacter sp. MIT 00-7814]